MVKGYSLQEHLLLVELPSREQMRTLAYAIWDSVYMGIGGHVDFRISRVSFVNPVAIGHRSIPLSRESAAVIPRIEKSTVIWRFKNHSGSEAAIEV